MIFQSDLDEILAGLAEDWRLLENQRLLLTGGTGFFGKWLTQALVAADRAFDLKLDLHLLSRNPRRAESEMPWLQGRVQWIEGDIRHVDLKSHGPFQSIIHGAAAASRDLNENQPAVMFDTILQGTRQVLSASCERLLFVSSGAVYGAQGEPHVAETAGTGPDPLDLRAAYGEAKRAAEFLCASAARQAGFEFKLARCFAFVGPYLPLDLHFAAGNFVRQILRGEPITIAGDGTPFRSYLYATDLTIWLLRILTRGQSLRAYNVGSDQAVSIEELARKTDAVGRRIDPDRGRLGQGGVQIAKTPVSGSRPEQYVPDVGRAGKELHLMVNVGLEEALERTIRWHLETPGS